LSYTIDAAPAGKADADGHSSVEVVGNKTEGALLMMVEAAGESPQQLKESLLHLDMGDKVCHCYYYHCHYCCNDYCH
jgi:Cation transport ATPase (P-type)